jgi:SAM-dependent methyltransferase
MRHDRTHRGLVRRMRRAARRVLERVGLIGPVYRALEWRLSKDVGSWPDEAGGLPVPPPYLVTLVASSADLDCFLAHGLDLVAYLDQLLHRHGLSFDRAPATLDFGCGCGRLARYIAPRVIAGGGRFIGLDINNKLIGWSAKNLPGEYRRNRLRPRAPVADASLDLLYAVSVFTHAPRASMAAWLEDYARMLKPGGVALVSFADEDRIDIAHPARRGELDRDGFLTSTAVLEGSNYMSSYATVAAFTDLAARYMEVIEVTPSGVSGQTLAWAVLRRRA